MVSQAVFASNLVLSDGSLDPEAGAVGRLARAASPLMIGLAAPLLLMMVIDPTALRHAQFLIVAILIPVLALVGGAKGISVAGTSRPVASEHSAITAEAPTR